MLYFSFLYLDFKVQAMDKGTEQAGGNILRFNSACWGILCDCEIHSFAIYMNLAEICGVHSLQYDFYFSTLTKQLGAEFQPHVLNMEPRASSSLRHPFLLTTAFLNIWCEQLIKTPANSKQGANPNMFPLQQMLEEINLAEKSLSWFFCYISFSWIRQKKGEKLKSLGCKNAFSQVLSPTDSSVPATGVLMIFWP